MRLLHCKSCGDVVRLFKSDEDRHCFCGRTFGRLLPTYHPFHEGDGIVLGVNERNLAKAIAQQPMAGNGPRFYAYVMPKVGRHAPQEELENAV